jgi:hypothetical protein
MLGGISDDKEFNKSVETEITTRQIAKTLFAMRCKAGLNQGEIAKGMSANPGNAAILHKQPKWKLLIRGSFEVRKKGSLLKKAGH